MRSVFQQYFRWQNVCSLIIPSFMTCLFIEYVNQYSNSNEWSYHTRYKAVNTSEHLVSTFADAKIKMANSFREDIADTILETTDVTFEVGLTDSPDVVLAAKRVSQYNKTVLLTFVNEAYLPFAHSWLCNTKYMNVHKMVLVVTSDQSSKENLTSVWTDITVIVTDKQFPKGNQEYSHVGYLKILIGRTNTILSLLLNDLDIMLFEFDYMWFENPVPEFQAINDVDILVNPVSQTQGIVNGGLVYLFATERTKSLWRQLTEMMEDLGRRIGVDDDVTRVSEMENDQQYLSTLINQRYADIRTRILPLERYADGHWYNLSPSEQSKTHPILISNNWIIGNKNKISRAKQWGHWFVRDDGTCDDELVSRTVYKGSKTT